MKCMNWQGYKTDEELLAVKPPQICSCTCLYSLNHIGRTFRQSKLLMRVGTSSWMIASKLWRKIDVICARFTPKNYFPSEKRAANYPNPSMRKSKEVEVQFVCSFINSWCPHIATGNQYSRFLRAQNYVETLIHIAMNMRLYIDETIKKIKDCVKAKQQVYISYILYCI